MGTVADGVAVGLRALEFIAALEAAGIPIFSHLFPGTAHETTRRIERRGLKTGIVGLVLVLAAQIAAPARLVGGLDGVLDRELQALLIFSDAGAATAVRLLGLALVVAALVRPGPYMRAVGLTGSTLIVASFALMGHTLAAEPRWLASGALLVHLGLVAFWFGALRPLQLASRHEAQASLGALITSFSHVAVRLVPCLFLAGLVMALVLVPDWASLGSPYGRLLLGKVLGFAILMMLAGLNKWRLGPRIARGEASALVTFRRSVAAEWLLISAVLVATAVMTSLYSPSHL